MKILALETSTQHGGAAVVSDGRIVAEFSTDRQRSHSELLNVFVDQALARANLRLVDIDLFAVGQGPGSFTGIRVAANAGRAFANVFDRPLVTIDSLTQIAAGVSDRSRPLLVLMNAFKNMVYYGLFDVTGPEPRATSEFGAASVREIEHLVQGPVTVAGDGYLVHHGDFSAQVAGRLIREEHPCDFPSAGRLGLLADQRARDGRVLSWKSFVPLYLRASEAEENRRGALFKSSEVKDPRDGKTR